jgi:hypothetical protein|tara:strand:+ start:154 stop:495 length:342 start_codon:yes stop_codon:yes gene_type:complete
MLFKQIFSISAIIGLLFFNATSANSATPEDVQAEKMSKLLMQIIPLAASGDYDKALGLAAQVKGDPFYDVLVINIYNQAAAKKDCKSSKKIMEYIEKKITKILLKTGLKAACP